MSLGGEEILRKLAAIKRGAKLVASQTVAALDIEGKKSWALLGPTHPEFPAL